MEPFFTLFILKAGSGAILRFCTGWLEKPVVEPKIRPVVEPNMTLLTVQTVCPLAHVVCEWSLIRNGEELGLRSKQICIVIFTFLSNVKKL